MNNIPAAIMLKLASVLTFTLMAALVKATADAAPVGQQVFFRSFFAIPVILIWLTMRRELGQGLRPINPIKHVFRGVIGTAAMGFMFGALAFLPLPEATALNYAAPLLVVVFAALFLGEDVRAFRMTAVLVGLLGVLIVLSPRFSTNADTISSVQMLGGILALAGAVCTAMAQIFIRQLATEERTAVIVFWFSVTSSVLALVTIPFGWIMPDALTLTLLVCTGLLGGIAQILLTSAYRFAPASVVAPFEYASMLLALVIGYFVFGDLPTLTMLIGAAIVIAAGLAIILRERQLGRRIATGTLDQHPSDHSNPKAT